MESVKTSGIVGVGREKMVWVCCVYVEKRGVGVGVGVYHCMCREEKVILGVGKHV